MLLFLETILLAIHPCVKRTFCLLFFGKSYCRLSIGNTPPTVLHGSNVDGLIFYLRHHPPISFPINYLVLYLPILAVMNDE